MEMELFLLTFVVLLLAIWYRNFKNSYTYWRDKNVKTLPIYPFIGTYAPFLSKNISPANTFKELYEHFSGEKYIGSYPGGVGHELFLIDPDVIKTVLVKDFNNFIDRGITHVRGGVLDLNLFMLTGDKWKSLRQRMTPTFTSSKMKKMFSLIKECGEELEANIKERILSGGEIEIKEMMSKYTTDTIGSCAFGLQINSMKDDDSEFRRMGRKVFQFSNVNKYSRLIRTYFPKLANFLNIKAFMNQGEVVTFFVGLVKELLKHRSSGIERNDFVQLMYELKQGGSVTYVDDDSNVQELEITDELITAQSFVFFTAGFETSATTMTFALRELAFNPDKQKLLQDEIDAVLKKHGDSLTYEAVQEMKYLDMVLDETLRLYPPIPTLNRICKFTHKLPDIDLTLEKGDKIVIPIYALQHDAKYFPEPEKFKPERFSKETGCNHHPFAYMPFGEGPRICIGSRFGRLQSGTGLISILRKYSVEPCSHTPKTLILDPKSFVLSCAGGITLRVVPRK